MATRRPLNAPPRLLAWLAPVATGLGALWLGQDASWDLRNYHFYVPFAFLHGRMGGDIAVAHVATYYNPLLHLPFYWAVTSLPPRAVGLLSGAAAGLNVGLLLLIATRLVARRDGSDGAWIAAMLAAVGFCGAMSLSELGTSFGDNLLSVPVLASVWMILRSRSRFETPGRRGWGPVAAAGVFAGLAAGLKLPFSVYALAAGVALFALRLPLARRLALATAFGSGGLVGLATSGGFWFLEMGRRFGNPLFPYFNDLFESPWASAGSYRHEVFIPSGWHEWLSFPFQFAVDPLQVAEVPFRDLRLPLLYVLLVAWALRAAWRWSRDRHAAEPASDALPVTDDRVTWLAWFVGVSFVAWAALFGVSRYVVPLEMLAPMLAWSAACALLPGVRLRPWIVVVAGIVLLATGQTADWGRRPWSDRYFGVVAPDTDGAGPALVLMAGYEPSGYMVPFLSRSARFLRIEGYFTGPAGTPNASDRAMRDAVSRHRGPLYLLYREYEEARALGAARHYGLRREDRGCQQVLPEVEPDRKHPFLFCRLERRAATSSGPGITALDPDPGSRKNAGHE